LFLKLNPEKETGRLARGSSLLRDNPEVMDTQVLIVGAGPTGLTLAIDLGKRGVRCMLIEQKPAPQFLPKMERCNARTMEIYRRMGIADRIRAAGLPASCPMDVFIVLSLVEPPLYHLAYPSVEQYRAQIARCEDASQPLEPYQLISQYTLEPLLKSIAESLPTVRVRYGCEFLSFSQDDSGVTAQTRDSNIRCAYLVGCDGGSSAVRRQLGIELAGEANLLELRQALYRCEELYERIPIGKGRHYHVADAEHSFLIVQDSTKHFTLHAVVERDADMAAQFEGVIAMPLKYEVLYVGKWRQNLLLADRYRDRRVFIAGDAAHLVIPTGGLGMNSGVGDAIDLSWKLAATLQGWGGPQLLACYETERRQIGARNVAASRFASQGRRKWRSMYRPDIRHHAETRANLVRVAYEEQPKSNEMIGAELGYRYENSPLLAEEPGAPPEHDFIRYHPTTWPGARLPHVWLKDGAAVQDRIGYDLGFTLLRFSDHDVSGLARAFAALGAPFRVLDLRDARARELYARDLILLRPDLHVAWRGNHTPEDPAGLARITTGHGAGT
jgi:2-polyprenyl-6-methoxyphenol hydroxylase-like FAD-dependent oxidoreductase